MAKLKSAIILDHGNVGHKQHARPGYRANAKRVRHKVPLSFNAKLSGRALG